MDYKLIEIKDVILVNDIFEDLLNNLFLILIDMLIIL